MPIFKKTSFKATRKVPKRQPDAGSVNPAQLTNDKAALDPNLDFSQTPLKLNLGGQCMLFQNGEWVSQDGKDITQLPKIPYDEINNKYARALCKFCTKLLK